MLENRIQGNVIAFNDLIALRSALSNMEPKKIENNYIKFNVPQCWTIDYDNEIACKSIRYAAEDDSNYSILLKPSKASTSGVCIKLIENIEKYSFLRFNKEIKDCFENSTYHRTGLLRIEKEKFENRLQLIVKYTNRYLRQYDTFLVNKDYICLITYICSNKDFSRHYNDVKGIIKSIYFKK